MIKNNEFSLILFIPEAGIYPYLRALSVVGDAAIKSGKKVFLTHCTGQMSRCPMIAMNRLPFDTTYDKHKHLCKICSNRFRIAQKKYNFIPIEFSDFIDSITIKNIENLLNAPEKDWENLTFNKVPIGKLAQYDFSIEVKCSIYSNLSKEHINLYLSYIKNTAIAVALADKISLFYKPSIFLTFNQYAQCQAIKAVAYNHNTKYLAITCASHNNIDTSRVIFYEHLNNWFNHCKRWDEFKKYPIMTKYVFECWKDVVFHFFYSGSHIFSNSKNGNIDQIFSEIGLSVEKKTIVVYTSSYDERAGYEKLLKLWGKDVNIIDAFPDQISWLKMLRNYAKQRNDIQIVVRIHPREGNRQFGHGSKHLEQLKEELQHDTTSFKVIWPDDPISSYDLLELADVCLVSWTTMGQEAARIGIPVLSCTGNMYYSDDDFIQVATTPEEYQKKLDLILSLEYTFQHLVKAIRFYHWRTFLPSLDLSETVPIDFKDDSIWPEAPKNKINLINNILEGREDLTEYNIRDWTNLISSKTSDEETEAVKLGIRYFLDKLFYPPKIQQKLSLLFLIKRKIMRILSIKIITVREKPFKDYILEYSNDLSRLNEFIYATKKNSLLRIIVAYGLYATLVHKGKTSRCMSPMIIRLVKLYETGSN